MPFVDSVDFTTTQSGDEIIDEVQRLLLSGQREEMNVLAQNVAGGATNLTFQYDLGGLRAGSLVNIDLETYRVWSVDPQNNSATVHPAYGGSRTDAHSAGALVYVNPRMSRYACFQALNREIVSLTAEGLYNMTTLEFTYTGAQEEYDLPATGIIDMYQVEMSLPGPQNRWTRIETWKWSPSSDTSAFPSGQSLWIPMGYPGRKMRVLYKKGFSSLSSPSDDVQAVAGVPPEMQDILSLGVLWRLGGTREVKRNFTEAQGDARRAGEVPPNAVGNSFKEIQSMRQMRIDAERQRLMMKWKIIK